MNIPNDLSLFDDETDDAIKLPETNVINLPVNDTVIDTPLFTLTLKDNARFNDIRVNMTRNIPAHDIIQAVAKSLVKEIARMTVEARGEICRPERVGLGHMPSLNKLFTSDGWPVESYEHNGETITVTLTDSRKLTLRTYYATIILMLDALRTVIEAGRHTGVSVPVQLAYDPDRAVTKAGKGDARWITDPIEAIKFQINNSSAFRAWKKRAEDSASASKSIAALENVSPETLLGLCG